MTEEDFIKAIQFREDPAIYDKIRLSAKIEIGCSMIVSASLKEKELAIKYGKERLTEMLLRHIYDDRRRELHASVKHVQRANPHTVEFWNACELLLAIAKRQPPAWAELDDEP